MRSAARQWRLLSNISRPRLPPSLLQRCATSSPRVRHSSITPERNIARLLAPTHEAESQNSEVHLGKRRRVNGFVRSVRKQKRVAFVAIGDGSTLESLQVVMTPQQAEGLSTGIGLCVTGQWVPSPSGKQQAYELHASEVSILGEHDSASYPLQKKYQSPEYLRTLPHLRTRIPFNSLLLRLRSYLIARTTQFFAERDFVQTHPPLITSSDCEGAGEVFTVTPAAADTSSNITPSSQPLLKPEHFFNTPKYLTVSSQLHLEALAQSVGKVWTLSPTFRAEKSDTPRHLSEFYMLEAEIAFTQGLSDVLDLVEDLIRNLASGVAQSRHGQELIAARSNAAPKDAEDSSISAENLQVRWTALLGGSWPRITFAEAVDFLREAQSSGKVEFEFVPSFENGLQAEHEKFLAGPDGKNGPVFVTDYPRNLKAFYMSPSDTAADNARPTVACFDLLLPEVCEVVGGSLREHRHADLMRAMERHGFDVNDTLGRTAEEESDSVEDASAHVNTLQWYLDLRKYGSVPHGGFGLGFDRLISYLSGVSNIRDTVTFPRWYKRSDC